jgi:disulfide bond formation protein DsbB
MLKDHLLARQEFKGSGDSTRGDHGVQKRLGLEIRLDSGIIRNCLQIYKGKQLFVIHSFKILEWRRRWPYPKHLTEKVIPMHAFVAKILTTPLAAQLLLAASLGALLFVFVMQYGFGLHPCVLCLWQRVPYGAAAVLALLAWVWRPCRHHTAFLLALCAVCYLAGLGLAVFHSGVELHWWLGTSGCAVQPLNGASADDLREALLHSVAPRCDQIAWTLFGLSMANYNIGLSMALAFFAAAAAAKATQKP